MTRIGLRFNESANVIQPGDAAEPISFERLLIRLKRQKKVIGLCAILGIFAGIFYIATTPPIYYAEAQVLVNNRLNEVIQQAAVSDGDIRDDAGIQNEIHIMRSAPIARQVVADLALYEDQVFLNPPSSAIGSTIGGLRSMIGAMIPDRASSGPVIEFSDAQRQAFVSDKITQHLRKSIRIGRVGQSYVLSVGYVSHDPNLAANVANAFAQAYLDDQLNANLEATERTISWMQDQLAELAVSSQQAALAVERFRSANNLTATQGQLVSEQRLDQLNTQLNLAEADAARAMALANRYENLIEQANEGVIDPRAVVNTTDDNRLAELEERYLNISNRLDDVIEQFGADHPQAQILTRQQAEMSDVLRQELARIFNEVSAQAAIEQARVDAIRNSVDQATSQTNAASQAQVELINMEKNAEAQSVSYENLRSRYEALLQQKNAPRINARILADAVPPRDVAAPRKSSVLMSSLVLGLLLGLGIVAMREFRERFFRTGDEIEDEVEQNFLGYLPLPAQKRGRFDGLKQMFRRRSLKKAPPPSLTFKMASRVLEEPRSAFAETLRNIRFALGVSGDDTSGCKVLGVTSALPGEGKSTVSSNLALLLAMSGHKTLLIDGDIRNPGLTRGLKIPSEKGLLSYLIGDATVDQVTLGHDVEKLHIIPCFTNERLSHYTELLTSKRMTTLLTDAQKKYSYVIIDLPPLSPVVDAKVIEPFVHKFLLVAAWGQTPRAVLRQQLRLNPKIRQKSLGVVLNKVDMEQLPSYVSSDTGEAYISTYANYHKA
ncbi:polysaccharide biosynthesis tyrosine autokinase [Pseudaestuariivita rosea]|uniref:polysaccharide biosynthesis tyrosine autokinase n=1 Tax=Pseudaestuariivita rosea TaxID=2763263 RepID=UPI001ABBD5B5|nr:polysaccharide biosynthesis tyrosine autokinase [Pseudaestuariivita rosea]